MYKSGENAPVQLAFVSKKSWSEEMIRLLGTSIIKRRVTGTALSDSHLDRNPCRSTDQQRTLELDPQPNSSLDAPFFFSPFALFSTPDWPHSYAGQAEVVECVPEWAEDERGTAATILNYGKTCGSCC